MRARRVLGFLFAIVFGAAAGLMIGWQLVPAPYANTAPQSLRSDYQADYVLMVAEVFQDEGSLEAAVQRLNALGNEDPLRSVQQAIVNAQGLGYSSTDIQALADLAQALQLPQFSTVTVQP